MSRPSYPTHSALWFSAGLSILAVAIALVLQTQFAMQPCAWCVFQRMLYLLIVILAIIAAPFARARGAGRFFCALAALVAAGGIAAAVYQYGWASKTSSCALTFPDRINMKLGLDQMLPWMFAAPAPCDQASIPLLGLPFPLWSALAFAVMLLVLARAAVRR